MENFLPFPVIQMNNSSSQEACIQPNQQLLNGKMNTPIHNASTYKLPLPPFLPQWQCPSQQPYQQPCYPCETHQLFETQHHYDLPFRFLPNLNATLENPRQGSLGFDDAMMFPPCPETPVMQEKGKGRLNDVPQQVIDLVNETPPYQFFHEKDISEVVRIVGQRLEPPTIPNSAKPTFKEVASSQRANENTVVRQSEGTSEQQPQIGESGDTENQGIDMNMTPQQKSRRKKHRPKVIKEGKPRRTPKPKTPKSVTPNRPNNTETPTVKRKYVRRKNLTPQHTPSSATAEVSNSEDRRGGKGAGAKSTRRCLNFDADDGMPTDNTYISACNREVANSQNQWRDVGGPGMNPCTTNVQQREPQTMGQTSSSGIAFDLNHAANSTAGEQVSFSREPARYQPLTANMTRIDQIPNISQGLRTPQQLRENLKPIERKDESRSDSILNGSLTDVLAMGMKRNESAFEDSPSPTYTNLIVNEINKVNRCHENIRSVRYPTEYLKKRRAEEYIEGRTSPSSSGTSAQLMQTPPRSWLAYGMPSKSSTGFTFADAQRIWAEQRMKSSKTTLPLSQENRNVHNPTESFVDLAACSEVNKLYCSGYPYKENLTNDNQDCTPGQTRGSNGRKRSDVSATSFDESIILNSQENSVANLHRAIEQKQLFNLLPSHAVLQHRQQADFSTHHFTSLGYMSPQAATSKRRKSSKKYSQVNSTQDDQNGCSFQGNSGNGEVAQNVAIYGEFLEDVIIKLQHLDINKEYEYVQYQTQNALVVYNGVKAMVPYGTSNLPKKRRPRVKVHLDEETNREWNLLMGKETADEDNRVDKDKEKYWEHEREVFRGRSESFIARMHLVQGDRRFSPWKGSVVDSVVGVFLTQNVSDHLSSSAFMALAAKFPLKRGNHENSAEKMNASGSGNNGHILLSDDDIRCKEKASTQESSDGGSTVTDETQNLTRIEYIESRSLACSRSSIDDRGPLSKGDESPESRNHDTSDIRLEKLSTVTRHSIDTQGSNRKSMEDAISSQNSVIYSSEYTLQASFEATTTPSRNEAETTIESMLHSMESSNTFTELLEIATGRTLLNYYGRSDRWGFEGSEDRTSSFYNLGNPYSSLPSLSMVNSLRTPDLMGQPFLPTPTYHLHDDLNSRVLQTKNREEVRGIRNNSHASESMMSRARNTISITQDSLTSIDQKTSEKVPVLDTHQASEKQVTTSIHHIAPPTNTEHKAKFQPNERGDVPVEKGRYAAEVRAQISSNEVHQVAWKSQKEQDETTKVTEPTVQTKPIQETVEVHNESAKTETKVKRGRTNAIKKNTVDWDSLRKDACGNFNKKERNSNAMDSVDWEAIRQADMKEISDTIRERGMNNLLAERIKAFLNRLVRDHGSIDLEWLRDVPPDKAKDYLLSIRGIGLKSVECVRLLTLHHKAFPVDTNVGRICVRLGWVPLQPLPESLQLHLLELYPVLETIQKYLWPRLCTLDQRTLYELHYQMITFGKVFCTKSKPNCNSCPMRGECKHFASAFASARLALPGPEEKSLLNSTFFTPSERGTSQVPKPVPLPQIEGGCTAEGKSIPNTCEPIIEEPATPEPESLETSQSAIDEAFYEDPDEIPTIKLNFEAFTQNIQKYMQSNSSTEGENELLSRALVLLSPEAASIPVPKLKNVSRLRTEHQVYELPDTHPLLKGLDKRETDDPCSYLLAIWTPGETAQSIEPPKIYCNSQETGRLCNETTCFACSSRREADTQIVRGTLLIPCRTAMRGSFPLNGTYFQVNEVFADHETSYNPMNVPRAWIWNLPRRTVYFGTSVPTIFKGLSTEGIQHCFWRGFVCVRGFDRTRRAPRPLYARLHFPASKVTRNKKTAAHQDK